ncbi:hypothetical protein L1987_19420 [Smallanthus sonchifolius]|uniref:Uncharacterized protein n=1 Tax=Smallanthus sonchifolius TaxID=185202 RepID=A0ACB9IP90_9ASTR|nr:hypothetical protein L1987_19420 [Smallanthus sonchifolius]
MCTTQAPYPSHLVIFFTTNHSSSHLIPNLFLFPFLFFRHPLIISRLQSSPSNPPNFSFSTQSPMATASATLSPVNFTVAAPTRSSGRPTTTKVTYIKGLNSFGGLKAHTTMASLGSTVSTEQQFANFVCSLRKPCGGGGGGGALISTCNAVGEIFRIAAIMNGITLVGVAIGFVLLRFEAYVEESE